MDMLNQSIVEMQTDSPLTRLAEEVILKAEANAFEVHDQHVVIRRADIDKVLEGHGEWNAGYRLEQVRNAAYRILESKTPKVKMSTRTSRRKPHFQI